MEACMAATFSATIRRYSDGVHVPRTFIMVWRTIVSQDAAISWPIIAGRKRMIVWHVFSSIIKGL
jgi:hypothetical protein